MTRISYPERDRVFGHHPQHGVRCRTPWGLWVAVHPLAAERFLAGCDHAPATAQWVPVRIDSFADRAVRNSTSPSLHAYSLAWDFFDAAVPGDVWGPAHAPDPAFRQAFKDFGFACGADYTGRKDYPHIEWAAGHPPPVPIHTTPSQPQQEDDDLTDAQFATLIGRLDKLITVEQEQDNRLANVERDVAAIKAKKP
jgi:hypothetical protein